MYIYTFIIFVNSTDLWILSNHIAGGKGEKSTKKQGWHRNPSSDIINIIPKMQPPSLHPPGLTPWYNEGHSLNLKCCLCLEVLNQPILVPCNQLVCGPCCSQWVAVSDRASCPCCYSACFESDQIRPPPQTVMEVLGSLTLSCDKCQKQVKAVRYLQHLKSNCRLETQERTVETVAEFTKISGYSSFKLTIISNNVNFSTQHQLQSQLSAEHW